jgi:uncharacterized oligopeptide transporter (OPT) family protein
MYFVPISRKLPIFGRQAASHWLWTVDLSPGFFGQGIITGPAIPLHMLIGAIVGWGFLSPFAKHQGWAPGEVDDWETGSRGWIIWVSLAALLADASVKLSWFVLRPFWRYFSAIADLWAASWKENDRGSESQSHQNGSNQYLAVPTEMDDGSDTTRNRHPLSEAENERSSETPTTLRGLGLSFLLSVIACTLAIHLIFGNIIPWYYTILAIALSLPMAVVGIRSLAETDYNPESALGMPSSTQSHGTPLTLSI